MNFTLGFRLWLEWLFGFAVFLPGRVNHGIRRIGQLIRSERRLSRGIHLFRISAQVPLGDAISCLQPFRELRLYGMDGLCRVGIQPGGREPEATVYEIAVSFTELALPSRLDWDAALPGFIGRHSEKHLHCGPDGRIGFIDIKFGGEELDRPFDDRLAE